MSLIFSAPTLRVFLLLGFFLSTSGCASNSQTVISIEDLTCASCLKPVTNKLKKGPGIQSIEFDLTKVELHIDYDPKATNPEKILELAKSSADMRFIMGPGKGSYPKGLTYKDELDVQTIVKAGEAIDIEKHLAAGKVTIVDFSAQWCGPCRTLAKHVYDLLVENPALALRKIEIVDWESPISRKYLGAASDLPYVRIYDKDQKFVGDMSGFKPKVLEALIEKAAK